MTISVLVREGVRSNGYNSKSELTVLNEKLTKGDNITTVPDDPYTHTGLL